MATAETLAKAIQVLNRVAAQEAAGVREVARDLGLSVSAVARLLTTWKDFGYVEQEEETRRYRLGVRLFELGLLYQRSFEPTRHMRPLLERFSAVTRETVSFSVLSNGERVCMDLVESPQTVKTALFVGKRELPHRSSAGKAMLAHLPREEVERIVKETGLPRYTERTVATAEELFAELGRIRERGFALDLEESEADVHCVGVPVIGRMRGLVGAVSLSAPKYRVSEATLETWGREIKDACDRLGLGM